MAQLQEKGSAVDAASDTFTELTQHFADGKTLRNPDALGGFLFKIAERRSMRYMRDGRPGQGHCQPLDPLGVRDERLASPPPAPPTYREPPSRPTQKARRRRRFKIPPVLLLIGGMLVVGRAVAPLLAANGPESRTTPDLLPASLAGTWQLEPFTDSRQPYDSTRTSQWIFTGSCDQLDECSFTWEPIADKTSMAFEGSFTAWGREGGRGGTLEVQLDKGGYTGTGTGTYGLAAVDTDGSAREFSIAKVEVTLHIEITQTELRNGNLIATASP